jgi:hypothetical protein
MTVTVMLMMTTKVLTLLILRPQASTSCCYSLSLPALPTTLSAGQASSPLRIASPASGLTVTVTTAFFRLASSAAACNASAVAAAAGSRNLTVTPAATLALSSGAAASFALSSSTGG